MSKWTNRKVLSMPEEFQNEDEVIKLIDFYHFLLMVLITSFTIAFWVGLLWGISIILTGATK